MDKELSLTGKRWVLTPLDGRDDMPEDDARALVELLKQSRGIDEAPMIDDGSWHNPGLFPDAQKAADRVHSALKSKEKIGIFGDYDCDGVTATAQIARALRRRNNEPVIRLPHRVHDGYGLKENHIQEFKEAGVTLLITVDTGVSAHAAVDAANVHGIDVIILDHHHVLSAPAAYAILHPALAPHFPHPHPSAAGVAFMFLHALEGNTWEHREIDLALATMGTIADLVMLQGNNRRLVQGGLRAMRHLPESPLKEFVESVSGGRAVSSTDVAFRLAPRINAAGRMADPILALRALLEGGSLLGDLDTLNGLRQDQTSRALEDALLEITPKPDGLLPSFLSIGSANYPHGILGLLAGKLTERFGRPSMAVHIAGELCTASFRSIPSYNIVEALHRHAHLLISHGGHAQAAGATFTLENYITLADALERDAEQHISTENLVPTLGIDAVLPASAVTERFSLHLLELEPFGMGNPEPLFLIEGVKLENIRRVGGEGKHLQAMVGACKVIGFNLGEYAEDANQPLDVLCRVGIDTWNGRVSPQMFIVDMRTSRHENRSYEKSESGKLQVTGGM